MSESIERKTHEPYLKTSDDFPFLKEYEQHTEGFLKLYNHMKENFVEHYAAGTGQVQKSHWYVMAFLANADLDYYVEWINKRFEGAGFFDNPAFQSKKIRSMKDLRDYVSNQFPDLANLISKTQKENQVINVWMSVLKPGSTIQLHTNDDEYQYRAHIGLIVPERDVHLRVYDTLVKWRTDQFFVFDTLEPHMAWNHSSQERVAMVVDFIRPDDKQKRWEQFEKQLKFKMETTPWGFEGGYVEIDPEIKKLYGHVIKLFNP